MKMKKYLVMVVAAMMATMNVNAQNEDLKHEIGVSYGVGISTIADGIGNASHIGLYIGRESGAIHSSYSKNGVRYSYFAGSTINGGWNRVGLWNELDYGEAVNEMLRQLGK